MWEYLNKGISTPMAIIVVLILAIAVGGFTWRQYDEMEREKAELSLGLRLPSKKEINIKIEKPEAMEEIISPLEIIGEAKGTWYFEADFPVILTNWDGEIIAETYAQTKEEWMTEDFVSFTSIIEFESPYKEGDPGFMKDGTIILRKANPSGLSENDDTLEIPIRFK